MSAVSSDSETTTNLETTEQKSIISIIRRPSFMNLIHKSIEKTTIDQGSHREDNDEGEEKKSPEGEGDAAESSTLNSNRKSLSMSKIFGASNSKSS